MSSPTSRRTAFSVVVVLSFSLLFTPAFGQSTGGRIIGRVAVSTGAVISAPAPKPATAIP